VRAVGWCELLYDRKKERVQVIEEKDVDKQAVVLREFVCNAPGAK
jgi:hypothetical protein